MPRHQCIDHDLVFLGDDEVCKAGVASGRDRQCQDSIVLTLTLYF